MISLLSNLQNLDFTHIMNCTVDNVNIFKNHYSYRFISVVYLNGHTNSAFTEKP